jgi:nucleoside-diphosphate-sugar epimerase
MGRVCFVTGSTGFVGLNLVDKLLSEGWDVHALHRSGSKRAALLTQLPHAKSPEEGKGSSRTRLTLVAGDLSLPSTTFSTLVPSETEVIFHVCHSQERTFSPARKMSQPGFQPEGGQFFSTPPKSRVSWLTALLLNIPKRS